MNDVAEERTWEAGTRLTAIMAIASIVVLSVLCIQGVRLSAIALLMALIDAVGVILLLVRSGLRTPTKALLANLIVFSFLALATTSSITGERSIDRRVLDVAATVNEAANTPVAAEAIAYDPAAVQFHTAQDSTDTAFAEDLSRRLARAVTNISPDIRIDGSVATTVSDGERSYQLKWSKTGHDVTTWCGIVALNGVHREIALIQMANVVTENLTKTKDDPGKCF